MQCRNRMHHTALGDYVTGATFALAALSCHAKLELDVVESQTGAHVAGNFTVGDAMADANNHDGQQLAGC